LGLGETSCDSGDSLFTTCGIYFLSSSCKLTSCVSVREGSNILVTSGVIFWVGRGRLAQIRRQIEREIQQAVKRKKSGISLKEQLKKYEKLLKDLEDSFQSGGISEENYLRLKEKYEKRIEKIKKELSED